MRVVIGEPGVATRPPARAFAQGLPAPLYRHHYHVSRHAICAFLLARNVTLIVPLMPLAQKVALAFLRIDPDFQNCGVGGPKRGPDGGRHLSWASASAPQAFANAAKSIGAKSQRKWDCQALLFEQYLSETIVFKNDDRATRSPWWGPGRLLVKCLESNHCGDDDGAQVESRSHPRLN